MIKAVFFDFDGTLSSERIYIYGCFRYIGGFIFERFGIENAGEKLIELFNEEWSNTFNRLFEKENIQVSQTEIKECITRYRKTPPECCVYEDAYDALKWLQAQGVKTAVISNGYYEIQQEKINKSGLREYLDEIEIPDMYGREYWKPDSRRGRAILDKMGLRADEVVYVGDSDGDFDFAVNIGMKMAYIDRPDKVNVFHHAEDAACILNDLKKENLCRLIELR